MKIIIVFDFFKESLLVLEVVDVIERGFKLVFLGVDYRKLLMVDGGEGIVQFLVDVINGWIKEQVVMGLLGELVKVFFGMMGDGKIVVIEMVVVLGLYLVFVDK